MIHAFVWIKKIKGIISLLVFLNLILALVLLGLFSAENNRIQNLDQTVDHYSNQLFHTSDGLRELAKIKELITSFSTQSILSPSGKSLETPYYLTSKLNSSIHILSQDIIWLISPHPFKKLMPSYPVVQQLEEKLGGQLNALKEHSIFRENKISENKQEQLIALDLIEDLEITLKQTEKFFVIERQTLIKKEKEVIASKQTIQNISIFVFISLIGAILLLAFAFINKLTASHQNTFDNVTVLSKTLDQIPVSVIMLDLNFMIEYVNLCFVEQTGRAASSVLGSHIRTVFPLESQEELFKKILCDLNNEINNSCDILNVRANGEYFNELLRYFVLTDYKNDKMKYIFLGEDVTEQRKNEQTIYKQAFYDSLTGLPNRALILDRLNSSLSLAQRNNMTVSVLFIDLDNFKYINDSFGHEVGDQVLIEASKRLQSCIRQSDTAGRLGGDEFILILNNTKNRAKDFIPNFLEMVIGNFRKPFQIQGHEIYLSSSVGHASYPRDGETVEQLFRYADIAMYQAKTQGKDTFMFFDEQMEKHIIRRTMINNAVKNAIRKKQLKVLFQPKVNACNGEIIGAEALLRWHHPKLGAIRPDEFIPIAESNGEIFHLDMFVLTETLGAISRLNQFLPNDARIAINLSPNSLFHHKTASYFKQKLDSGPFQGSHLELEITERILIQENDATHNTLNELSDLGIHLVMDDFGTGYSSVSYLRQYPFTALKIDRTFISDIITNEKNKSIVRGTIKMAHELGMKVVSEGIETIDQLEMIQLYHCDFAQGFLFGEPMPLQELEQLIIERKQSQQSFTEILAT